ncbi:4'-phosphopantetheinyl transferase family protein [Paenibacillus massiliensis]|uniref:4'-phosphopantetheinyl transferase family protein n=1 Tax=Paenibacillus massiliensis TaxID=225917 RepID=UPI000472DA95|nr:4'-phosphopantetheinyl transferase superfamily protein [Paenibacillus massiliensis]
MEIYALDITEEAMEQRYDELTSWVSRDKRDRLARYHHRADALRSLGGDVLARWVLCRHLDVPNHRLQFGANAYGKPSLSSHEGLYYNVSHAGRWVVCAVDFAEIGIDVEAVKPVEDGVARMIMSDDEYMRWGELEGKPQLDYFYDIWTLKESLVKAEGKGLSIPLDSISFDINIGIQGIALRTKDWSTRYQHFRQYDLDAGYKLAASALHPGFPDKLDVVTVEEIQLQ